MVGRFIEQKHVGLRQEQATQRNAALLATGELADIGIPGRQAQRIGGDFELAFKRVRIGHRQQTFQALLFGRKLVEIGAFLGVCGIHLIETLLRMDDLGNALFDDFTHRLVGIESRFLFEIADLGPWIGARLTLKIGIRAGHDAQHGRFAGTIHAQQADLGAGEERKRDVLDDLALGRNDLADAVHRVNVLHYNSGFGAMPTPPIRPRQSVREKGTADYRPSGAGRHV